MIETRELKRELAEALNAHIQLLKDVEMIDEEHMEAFTFMMRSFGFMLDRGPTVLIEDDNEELYFMMFQYYSLLTELKYNILLNFPYSRLQGKKLMDLLTVFPTTYEKEMKEWWEQKTGLEISETKQTIEVKELEY